MPITAALLLLACSGARERTTEAPVPPVSTATPAATPPPPPPPGGPGGTTPDGRPLPPRLGALPTKASLCQGEEESFFSCTLTDSRMASLCGHLDDDDAAARWLQFRLGRLDALEVRFPPGPESSVEVFTYGVYVRPEVSMAGVRFSTGRVTYEVFDDAVEGTVSRGVTVTMPDGTETQLPCQGEGASALWSLRAALETVELWR